MTKSREEILKQKVIYEQRRREKRKAESLLGYRESRAQEAKRRRDKKKEADAESLREKERQIRLRRTPEQVALAKKNTRQWLDENPHKRKEYMRNRHVTDPGWFLVPNAKRRAQTLKVPFDLKKGDFEIPTHCPVLGIALDFSIPERGPNQSPRVNAPSLDRIVPALGYVKGNVEVVSFRANMVKNDGTAAEHEAVARYMRERGAA